MNQPARPSQGDDPPVAPSDAADAVEQLSGFYGEVMDTWSTHGPEEPRRRRRRRPRRVDRRQRDRTSSQAGGRAEQAGGRPSRIVHLVDGDLTVLWEAAADLVGDTRTDGVDRSIAVAALIARATCRALDEFPALHASYDPAAGGRRQFEAVDLGIAVTTIRGPTVTTIEDVHTRSLRQLAIDLAGIVARYQHGTVGPSDRAAATFTVDVADLSGRDGSGAVLSTPKVGHLDVGSIREGPWVHEGELATRRVARLRLVHDARVCDHTQARRFIEHTAHLCENPAA